MASLWISRDDLFSVITIVSFMGLVVGLAAVILWLRDRSRDRRGVPEWIRRRGQLKAARVATAYGILVSGGGAISLIFSAIRVADHYQVLFLALTAAVLLWGLSRLFVAYRVLSRRITDMNRENEEGPGRPYEPLG